YDAPEPTDISDSPATIATPMSEQESVTHLKECIGKMHQASIKVMDKRYQTSIELAEMKAAVDPKVAIPMWVDRIQMGEATLQEAILSLNAALGGVFLGSLCCPLLDAYLQKVRILGKEWYQEEHLSTYSSDDLPVLSPPDEPRDRPEAHTKIFRVHEGIGDFVRKGVKRGYLFTVFSLPGDRKHWKPIFTSRILRVDLDSLALEDFLPTRRKSYSSDAPWTCYGKWVIHPPLPAGVIIGDRRQPVRPHEIIYSMDDNPWLHCEVLLAPYGGHRPITND
ncbi:MAG: hypothetical protein V3R58_05875, partial [candidate division NC10 bacterium]